jgi:hypothetical protein
VPGELANDSEARIHQMCWFSVKWREHPVGKYSADCPGPILHRRKR